MMALPWSPLACAVRTKSCRITNTEGDDWQDQVLDSIEEPSAAPGVIHPADWQRWQSPLPKLRREEENQQQCQPESRHRKCSDRQDRNCVVEPRATFGRGVDPERNRQQEREDERDPSQQDRIREHGDNAIPDRRRIAERNAEIPPNEIADPFEIPHRQWLVEPHV